MHTNDSPQGKNSNQDYINFLITKPSEYSNFSDRETVFTAEEIEEDTENSQIILHLTTPEQFYWSFQVSLRTSYSVRVVIENNLYFQNDPVFRDGFTGYFYANDFKGKTIESANGNTVIIQGVQITGASAIRIGDKDCTFNNCYLKDWVFTKTTGLSKAFGQDSGTDKLNFNYCKLSMHIRAFEWGYEFDGQNVTSKNCSRYIEYSDLVDDEVPIVNGNYPIFAGKTENCSTIVKNLALAISTQVSYGPRLFFAQTVNSSWDVEFGVIKYIGNLMEASGDEDRAIRISDTYQVNNCFLSFKTLRRIFVDENGDPVESYVFPYDISMYNSNMVGVNIYNKGNPNQASAMTTNGSTQVAQLTDDECHSYAALNRYGFFVNQAYEFELLTSQPTDWTTNYGDYYRKYDNEYVKIMDVSAPTFEANTFYEKVEINTPS